MFRIYAYAVGSDLHQIEQDLVKEFERFSLSWGVDSIRLRNVKAPPIPGQENKLPDWNIGFSAEVPKLEREQIEKLVSFLSAISSKYDRQFVIGTWDAKTSTTEDLCFVKGPAPLDDIDRLAEQFNAKP